MVLSDRAFGRKIGSTLNKGFILKVTNIAKVKSWEGKTVTITRSKIVGSVAKCAAC